MSDHLNDQQRYEWREAVAAVEEVAANTDTMSSSKDYLVGLARQVRSRPEQVIRELARI